MGFVKNFLVAVVAVCAAKLIYSSICETPTLPDIPEINYWGQGAIKPDNKAIKPFKINISDDVLKDLKERLSLELRIQPSLENTNFEYGFGSSELQRILKFWNSQDYDWRSREKVLNSLPQYTTQIFGLNIHFIHAKPINVPENMQVVPLLLIHGFPGSVKEFYNLIPVLTAVDRTMDFVFEVIAPSLPGYAFSDASQKRGLSPAHMAAIFRHLMLRLGHHKFYVQGGDWGAIITADIATLYPDNVLGMHSTMCAINTPLSGLYMIVSSIYPSLFMDQDIADRVHPLSEYVTNSLQESGYLHIQASKPDTLGVGLNNSPAGLAAYILEKFSSWTDMAHRNLPDGGLERKFKLSDLLDNVMLYWVTGSITSSMRIYAEYFSSENQNMEWDRQPVNVPSFCAQFPHELLHMPDFVLRLKYKNLLPVSVPDPSDPLYPAVRPPRGGHFSAFEEPLLLANSIVKAVQMFRQIQET